MNSMRRRELSRKVCCVLLSGIAVGEGWLPVSGEEDLLLLTLWLRRDKQINRKDEEWHIAQSGIKGM